jgi:hypothetical protein
MVINRPAYPRSRRLRIGIGVALAVCAVPAHAADWSVNPTITGSYEYNDNTRMALDSANAVDVSGAGINAAVELRADMPLGYFSIEPRIRSTFYPDDEAEETDSQWLLAKARREGERSRFDVRAQYSSIETLGSYLPDDIGDPGGPIGEPDPGDPTGGRAGVQNREDRFLIAPVLTYELTERHGMEIGVGYVESDFEERVDEDREDYEYIFGHLGYVYLLTPSKTLNFDANLSQFDDENNISTYVRGLSIEWRNLLSETSEFYAMAGVDQSYVDNTPLSEDWRTGFTGGIGVRWSFEVSKILLDLRSGLDPSSSGRLVQRNELQFHYNHFMSPHVEFITGARLLLDGGVEDEVGFEEREYANAQIGLRWRFARDWSLGGLYTYVWSEYENDPSSASANRVSIGVTWEPNRR